MLRAAIANEYRIRILPSPTTHETISLLFRGFKNDNPHQRTVKLPITEEILTKMYSHLYQPSHGRDGLRASVVLWRTVWRISLEYHTLGRFSDIVKLKRQDIVYESNPSPHLKILFIGGKNDQYFEGSERVVAANPSGKNCPVQLKFFSNCWVLFILVISSLLVRQKISQIRINLCLTVAHLAT